MKWIVNILLLWILSQSMAWAQSKSITLEECQQRARQNYPLIKQKELIAKTTAYTLANVNSAYLPQLTINGQATYQSDVTAIPIKVAGIDVPILSKDQYKVYAEVSQTIYDGGVIKSQADIQKMSSQVEDQKVEVELYKLKDRINQLYFGVLLIDRQILQSQLLNKDLDASLKKTEAAVKYGTALQSNADLLQAELLKNDERMVELNAARLTYLDVLGYFIQENLPPNTQLQEPQPLVLGDVETIEIKRPEISFYQYQSEMIDAQYHSTNSRNLPKIGFFIQGGYGRPALNLLKNEFDTYYLGGIRLNWNLSGFYNTKRDKQLWENNLLSLDAQKEAFLFNTHIALKQSNHEIDKLDDMIQIDKKIIELRIRIKNTAQAQYDNGVITTNDYLQELNAEDQAKQNLSLHEVQLMMAKYNYQTTSGN